MICPKCGREIPDGTVCPCSLTRPPLSNNPALNALKTVGSSPAFLIMAILFSLSALLNILASTQLGDTLSNFYMIFYQMGVDPYQVQQMMDAMRSTSVVSAVVGSIPAILMAVAMWIHFGTCSSRQNGNITTAGLTICKVLLYISMIGVILTGVLVVGCVLIFVIAIIATGASMGEIFGSGYYGFAQGSLRPMTYVPSGGSSGEEAAIALIVILIVALLIVVLAFVLGIAYNASFIRMINRTKTVALTGVANDKVSGFLVGMTGFTAVMNILGGLIALFTAPLSGLASIVLGVAYILVVVLLRTYGREMNKVLYPPVRPASPVYGGYQAPGQQYAPQQPQQYTAPAQAPVQTPVQNVPPQNIPQPPQDGQGQQPPQPPVV